jgi:hypothetical protein
LPENGGGTWVRIAGPIFSESSFRAATLPLDSETAAYYARSRKTAIAERDRQPVSAPLIGPRDPPANLVGGYRFPNAPEIDLSPIGPAPVKSAPIHVVGDPLAIPDFLRRAMPEVDSPILEAEAEAAS